jgi:hypothetical protein
MTYIEGQISYHVPVGGSISLTLPKLPFPMTLSSSKLSIVRGLFIGDQCMSVVQLVSLT